MKGKHLEKSIRASVLIPIGTPWLTPAEAAAYLRLSRTHIYRLVGEGDLESYSIGGKTLLKKDDLDAWVEKGKRRWKK